MGMYRAMRPKDEKVPFCEEKQGIKVIKIGCFVRKILKSSKTTFKVKIWRFTKAREKQGLIRSVF